MHLLSALLATATIAGPPPQLSVQGVLKGPGGVPLHGTYELTFRLFDKEAAGVKLWPAGDPQAAQIDVSDGLFSVTLENVGAAVFAAGEEAWLELTLLGEPPLPRVRVRSTPMSLLSQSALGLSCTACVSVGALAQSGCTTGQTLVWGGEAWACGDPPVLAEADPSVDVETPGAVPVWNGTALVAGAITDNGQVGVGTATPQAALDVAGGVRVGVDDGECTAARKGTLRYNDALQVCDGAAWVAVTVKGDDPPPPTTLASCKALLDAGKSTGDGVYTIDPDGVGGIVAFQVYCDMSTDGGGWTLLGKQVKGDCCTNWAGGAETSGVDNQGTYSNTPMPGTNSGTTTRLPFEAWNALAKTNAGGAFKSNSNRWDGNGSTGGITGYWKASCVIAHWDQGSADCYVDYHDRNFTTPRRTANGGSGSHGAIQGYGGTPLNTPHGNVQLTVTGFQCPGSCPAVGHYNKSNGQYDGYEHDAGVMFWFR